MLSIIERIAQELGLNVKQIEGAVALLDDGATVPFIARYRKEMTGEMDDSQLRTMEERLTYLRELDVRREAILKSIEEQGKLNDSLKKSILAAETKTQLEDLYLPYKKKRRTKGQMAIEAGLLPLAESLFENPELDPQQEAEKYLSDDADNPVADIKAALDGARYILMERFAEDAALLDLVRTEVRNNSQLKVTVAKGQETEGAKFQDYFDYSEPLKKVPSHRMLAVLRGRNEGVLRLELAMAEEGQPHPCESMVASHVGISHRGRPADDWLKQVASWTWSVKLAYQIESELVSEKRAEADAEAIKVFASNLNDLLLAAPAGPRTTLGLDPGYRSGVKVVIVGATGKILDHCAIYPHAPQNQWDKSIATLAALCAKHKVELVSIGNGTASRETDKLAAELMSKYAELKLTKIMVSEAGASVYSASEFAAKEFPDLDVTIRGAISIARRLQDPLAELVKIEPKAIGVGQYQHDVNQVQLAKGLDAVVEDCVNAVGVDLNTASAPLLARVSGITQTTASNIVDFREQNGFFDTRKQLLDVPRLGPKVFEQAAGFLRIMKGTDPLDASCVHPESYKVVKAIAKDSGRDVKSIIGDLTFLRQIKVADYVSEKVGELTLKDIIKELEKPGRDPRPEFKTAEFKDGIEKISDLKEGMTLEGVVTNVTNFGAFVDVGVHQDGLVHISALSYEFVKDPREAVKAGQIVKVKVMEVDVHRKRIALTMRLDDKPGEAVNTNRGSAKPARVKQKPQRQQQSSQQGGAMADALLAALKK